MGSVGGDFFICERHAALRRKTLWAAVRRHKELAGLPLPARPGGIPASDPVWVRRPAALDRASSRPRLAATPWPFSLPSALRKPGHRTFTYEVTRHARRTRLNSAARFSASAGMNS